MEAILTRLARALGRIFPDCVTLSQAIAFNMFLAFFPLLLFTLGLLGGTRLFHDALQEIPTHLSLILPPGSAGVVSAYFVRKTIHTWKWMVLGLGGTLITGMQVMVGYIEGFRVIEGDLLRPGYWRRQARALVMLCLTLVPMLAVVILTVFGKQTRAWLMVRTQSVYMTRELEITLSGIVVFVLAMGVLVVLYRLGRPEHTSTFDLLPGALVATILWWAADIIFGWYVRKMPYDAMYRGLAAAIGLLIWMFLTAMIVLMGAAYNAEAREDLAVARAAATPGQAKTLTIP
ncbi:MAG TPA: YihY/virulence factor BrkB family protein [Candidatus Acidoferrales bacterium]|jgi:membrane protein|nr:YihY/virulence factor BrkB family protein [Candidatus Acidoferrales bacterium]